MRTIRLYLPQTFLEETNLSLANEAFHHAIHVLRGKVGDHYILFDGQGNEAQAELKSISRREATLFVSSVRQWQIESPLNTLLIQCISKGERMDYTVQKATELGISTIQPVSSERCNVQLDKKRQQKKQQHWQAIIINACEQCGRNNLPELLPLITLEQALVKWQKQVQLLFLHPEKSQHFDQLKLKQNPPTHIGFIAGPEGGFSEKEVTLAQQLNITALSLGPRILRSETAGITALAIAQSCWGDLK